MKMLKALLTWRMLVVLLMGFSSGLPIYLIGATLKGWLSDTELDLTTIGFFTAVSLPYTFKFLWSPFLDRYTLPLGRRRGWLALTQIALVGLIILLSRMDPVTQVGLFGVVSITIAFFSATQDIAVDAYRREVLADLELGMGNSLYVMGYRFSSMFAQALAFFLAGMMPWSTVYLIMACGMVAALVVTLLAPEPKVEAQPPRSIQESFIGPMRDYFSRPYAWWILIFIVFFKLGDSVAAEQLTQFYKRGVGFTNEEVGTIVKAFGIWAVIGGGLFGGAMVYRFGMLRCLFAFGVLQALSTLGFVALHYIGHSLPALAAVVTFENVTSGMGTAAFVAFMAAITNKKYTATQLSLLTSLTALSRQLAIGAGWFVDNFGWAAFFTTCTLLAVPGLALILKIRTILTAIDDSSKEEPDVFRPEAKA